MDATFVIILGLLIINLIAYIVCSKKNHKLLTLSEKDELSKEIVAANRNERWQLWVTIPIFPLAILLDIFFRVNNTEIWFRVWVLITTIWWILAAFRNRRIQQKLNFPDSFVKSEFSLSLSMTLLFVTLIIYSIWLDIK